MSPEAGDAGDAAALEAGRLAFARPWRFIMGVSAIGGLPPPAGIEIAFAGRSNVGKSSLINALTGQGSLARTSNTPGRTQELNYFTADDGIVIVDMPGYGYARAPLKQVKDWTRLVFDFLRGRANLRRVYVLVDARHGLKANDREAFDVLDKAAVSYQVVLTKCDKERPDALARVVAETSAALRKRAAAHPEIITTSSSTGAGIDVLRAEIVALRPPSSGPAAA